MHPNKSTKNTKTRGYIYYTLMITAMDVFINEGKEKKGMKNIFT